MDAVRVFFLESDSKRDRGKEATQGGLISPLKNYCA